jgi:SAM-dependent methyltransferase
MINININTLDYYNKNSDKFFLDTVNLDLTSLYKPFMALIPNSSHILDAGCGSGRDSLYFLKKGYKVTAFDASEKLVKLSSELIGQKVLHLSFEELDFEQEFDAIWACGSLLHVPKQQIDNVINKLIRALKPQGIIYASFKYGDGEKIKDGRLFTNYDEYSFQTLVKQHPELMLKQIWITEDVRPNRQNEKWLNVILGINKIK